jgi:hypothetical protein
MFQAISQGASAVVASIASPFRRGLPVWLTNFYSAEIESEESIHLRAAKDYAERGNGGDSDLQQENDETDWFQCRRARRDVPSS